ncbi:MAG: hypothetical protein LAN84_00365 [Acidobacteriia bacterium]|nr:hypothetical protein [Terriglobia bacterium]
MKARVVVGRWRGGETLIVREALKGEGDEGSISILSKNGLIQKNGNLNQLRRL